MLRKALASDPARLRRALIEQRRGKTQGDGLLFRPLVDAQETEGPDKRHTDLGSDLATYGSAQVKDWLRAPIILYVLCR